MASMVKDGFAKVLVGLWHTCDFMVRDGLLTLFRLRGVPRAGAWLWMGCSWPEPESLRKANLIIDY